MSQPRFTLFVSSVEGHTVYRFGTNQLIGAKRRHDPPAKDGEPAGPMTTFWDTKRIVAITDAEERLHGKSYRRCFRDKALIQRTEAEWKAQCEADAKAEKAARDAAEQAAQKAAEQAATNATQTPDK